MKTFVGVSRWLIVFQHIQERHRKSTATKSLCSSREKKSCLLYSRDLVDPRKEKKVHNFLPKKAHKKYSKKFLNPVRVISIAGLVRLLVAAAFTCWECQCFLFISWPLIDVTQKPRERREESEDIELEKKSKEEKKTSTRHRLSFVLNCSLLSCLDSRRRHRSIFGVKFNAT